MSVRVFGGRQTRNSPGGAPFIPTVIPNSLPSTSGQQSLSTAFSAHRESDERRHDSHSLPPELLDHILDLVRGPRAQWSCHDGPVRNADLLSAALVCRRWAVAAQRVLWRDTRITLNLSKRIPDIPELAKYPVKHLSISVRGVGVAQATTTAATDWTEALLERTPLLRSLCLTTGDWLFGPQWSFFRSNSLSGLKTLDLEYCESVRDPLDIATPFPFHLTHLGLYIYPTAPSSHLLKALFSSSRDTLKSLRLTLDCQQKWRDPHVLDEFLSLVTDLERIDLDFRVLSSASDPTTQVATYANLGPFTKLRHLGLLIPHPRFDEEIFSILFSICFQQLPPTATLTHLDVGIFKADRADFITSALALPALAELKRVDLVNLDRDGLEAKEAGVGLMEECEQRGVTLVFQQDLL